MTAARAEDPGNFERPRQGRIAHADELACDLWAKLGLESTLPARHRVRTIVAAVVSSRREAFDADACIDTAARLPADPGFDAFVHQSDARESLRRLARDAYSAARSVQVEALAELVYDALLLPSGGREYLSPAESEAVASCAASICAAAVAGSLVEPGV